VRLNGRRLMRRCRGRREQSGSGRSVVRPSPAAASGLETPEPRRRASPPRDGQQRDVVPSPARASAQRCRGERVTSRHFSVARRRSVLRIGGERGRPTMAGVARTARTTPAGVGIGAKTLHAAP
jgi:hypothetical protein